AEDGIRDKLVTGVQTCALPISRLHRQQKHHPVTRRRAGGDQIAQNGPLLDRTDNLRLLALHHGTPVAAVGQLIREELSSVRMLRSEERRVGKEWRSRRWADH